MKHYNYSKVAKQITFAFQTDPDLLAPDQKCRFDLVQTCSLCV